MDEWKNSEGRKIKILCTTMAISNCLFSLTSENPNGFSIRFVFTKLVAETRNEIIHKTVVQHLKWTLSI